MLLNCEVLSVVLLPLPTARPMKQFVPKLVLDELPTFTHEVPLLLLKTVMVEPVRLILTHVFGTVPELLELTTVLPPVVKRVVQR